MDGTPVNLAAYWRLLRTNRNVRLLWLGQLVSQCGDWLYMIAIFDLLLELTGSAKAVAFAFVMMVLPQTFVSPAAGVLNDRLSRRRVMLVADWARAGVVLAMLFAQSADRIWLLYALLVLETVFWAMYEPARTAVIPNITCTPSETLVANSLSSMTWAVTLAAGSALGGLLAATLGRQAVFIINALSFVVSAYCAWGMRFREPHLEEVGTFRLADLADFRPIIEGFRYVTRDRGLFATLLVKAGLGFMGTNWVLLTLFGERIFPLNVPSLGARGGAMLGMSLLMGFRGFGAFLGPLIAGRATRHDHRLYRIAILIGFACGAAGYLALGQAEYLWMACIAVALAHGGGSIGWVYSTTLLQAQTEDRFRGRVFSAEFALSMLTISVVSYSAGVLADEGFRPQTLATATGLLILLPALLWAIALRCWFRE